MKNQLFPCLWFESDSKSAAEFYCSIFRNSKIIAENNFAVTFSSSGQNFLCLNGNHHTKFNSSISFIINSSSKEELTDNWEKMIKGSKVLMPLQTYPWSEYYGWIQDRFGINWQLMLNPSRKDLTQFIPAMMFSDLNFGKAEAAIKFYTSIFDNSELKFTSRYGSEHGDQAGKINHAQFKLNDQLFAAMDSGVMHGISFNEAISLVITCDTQSEIDFYWDKLSAGGKEGQCGWLKDRFGLSWQVVPSILPTLLADPSKSKKVMEAFLKMKKFDLAILEKC
jgi:predicted 3-demethylubiquinone-9 3-methyltransferase (glyoxalase superfamily)